MLKLVLETSVLHEDYELSKAPLIELLNIAGLAGAKVIIPQVVFAEHVSHFNRDIQKYQNIMKSTLRSLRQLPLTNILDFEFPQPEGSYDEYLTRKVASKNIEIQTFPQASHADILARCLKKIRPFGPEKDTGYKDTLIWETILQILCDNPEDTVLFVTKDGDYRKKSTESLHKNLVDELVSLGYSENIVKLKISLKAASDYLREAFGLESADLIPAIAEQIKENINFDEFLTEHSTDIESCIEENSEDILRGDPVTDPSLLWNVEGVDVEIESTEVLDTGDVIIYATAEFENEVMYWTFYSSYACDEDSMSEYGISLYEADAEADSAWVGGSMRLHVEFSFVYTPNNHSVSGFEASSISRIYI